MASFASVAAMRMCDPMLATLAAEFRESAFRASHVVSAFALTYGLLQLIYGPLGDRIGKMKVIAIAAAGSAVAAVLAALAQNLGWLVAGRALMGATAAGAVPLAMAWIGDRIDYGRRQEVLARLMAATVSGMIAGQFLGGLAADTVGWRAAFWLFAVLFGLAALLLWRQARLDAAEPAGAPRSAPLAGPLRLMRLARVRWVLAATAAEGALAFGTLAFVPTLLGQRFGFSVTGAGAAMALYGLGGPLFSRVAARRVARLGERGLARIGGAMVVAALLALAHGSGAATALLSCFCSGLGFHMLHSTLQAHATQMAPQARGSAVAVFACTLFLGQSAGVMVVAAGIDHGMASAVFTLAAAGMVVLVWRRANGLAGRGERALA